MRSVATPRNRHYLSAVARAEIRSTNNTDPLLYEVELQPHRSLSPTGFNILIGVVAFLFFAVGVAFLLAGAWPVVGFLGAEVLLLYAAFRINYGRARLSERLQLSEDALVVRRLDLAQREQVWRFQTYWLRVAMPNPESSNDQLILSSHGHRLTIGAFLPPAQRVVVATTLRNELAKVHNVYYG